MWPGTPSVSPRFRPGARIGAGSAGQRDDPALGVEGGLAAQPLELGARHLVARVVAGAHQRGRLDVLETEPQGLDLHLRELVGVVVALQGKVLYGRSEVLADGQDVDIGVAQRLERL